MSEFSDSYHLAESAEGAVALIRRAARDGIVIPEGQRFTCILVDQPEGGADPALLRANTGLLVQYWYSEDHGVWLYLFDLDQQVSELSLEWVGDRATGGTLMTGFDPLPWSRRDLFHQSQIPKLTSLVAAGTLAREVGYEVARLVGLSRFEHLSCDPTNVKRGPWEQVVERALERFPEATVVEGSAP